VDDLLIRCLLALVAGLSVTLTAVRLLAWHEHHRTRKVHDEDA
jgi:hypothetical protein